MNNIDDSKYDGRAKRNSLSRELTLEVVRTTEQAAIAAAKWRGRGDEKQADQAAVNAMRRELGNLSVSGKVVIGEGERDDAPMLYIGEKLGKNCGPQVDIAVDPLEGTTLCAKNMADSLAVIAIAPKGGLLHAPDVYMNKIAVGSGLPRGVIDLDDPPEINITRLAKAKGVNVRDITACILDRPRHAGIIAKLRKMDVAIKLIGDGDIAAVIHTANSEQTGIDIYLGIGGAPEGVLAAAALRCTGGQFEGRLVLDNAEKRARAAEMGIVDGGKKFLLEELAGEDVFFAASGVTGGSLLKGVVFGHDKIITDTMVMRSKTLTFRRICGYHSYKS